MGNGIYRNMELNTIKKLDYPKSMSIPSDSYKTRVEAHGNKNFRCDSHYVSQIQTQQQNKEDKGDQDISNENIQSRSVNESENPDNLEGKVGNESENPDNLEGKAGRPGVWDSHCHNEMHCITGIQSGGALFHVKQSCSKGNVNERQKSNIMDMDSSRATLSIGTPVLLNTTGPRKRGRPRKIKEPITTGPRKRGRPRKIKEPIWNYNNNTNDCRGDFADKDCDSDMQSAGTPVLVNTMEPKGKPVRPRLVGSTPVLLNTTEPRKRGRPRKIKEPNTAGPRKSERPRKIKEPNWNYNNNTNDCRGDFADKDCESHMQSAGTPVLVNTMEPKRKPGRPRLFGVKRNSGQQRLVGLEKRPGRPRKMKEPICSNDNHHDEKNYTDIDRDERNKILRSHQVGEANLFMCDQSAGLQTYIDGDKSQDELRHFVDSDCDNALSLFPAANIGNIDPNKIARNAPVHFVDHEIEWDPSPFLVCRWCEEDFDFRSVSRHSPSSWVCPDCKSVNNVRSL